MTPDQIASLTPARARVPTAETSPALAVLLGIVVAIGVAWAMSRIGIGIGYGMPSSTQPADAGGAG